MASENHVASRKVSRMRFAARFLALLWAGWWIFFGMASGFGEEIIRLLKAHALLQNLSGLHVGPVLLHAAWPGLVFLLSVVVAWRWETIGGALLVFEGLLVLVAYPLMTYRHMLPVTILFVVLTMALPPLVAGALFLAHRRASLH